MRLVTSRKFVPTIVGLSFIFLLGLFYVVFSQYRSSAETNQPNEKNVVVLSKDALKMADIQLTTLTPQPLAFIIKAPGEIIPNANLTTKVTTRVPAQIVQRYVQEGQHVKAGQPLMRLSSVEMAKAQGDLLLADQEWTRVKSLGKDAISAKRYAEAQVSYQRAYATALAYGMTEPEINELLKTQKASSAKGEFKLLAPRNGTIFNINFTEGELVETGRVLLQVVEESSVWVEAKLAPTLAQTIAVGNTARISLNQREFNGKVIQVHHQLNETTRTRAIRLEVPNQDDLLHPGQYVNCFIQTGTTEPVLAIPLDATIKTADGDDAIYIEIRPGAFQLVEIQLGEVIDNHVIVKNIAPGTRVVTHGAFFIHAEQNKKGFDAHTH